MKEGEEEKTKTYSALIWTDKAIQREDIAFLDDIKVPVALLAALHSTCPGDQWESSTVGQGGAAHGEERTASLETHHFLGVLAMKSFSKRGLEPSQFRETAGVQLFLSVPTHFLRSCLSNCSISFGKGGGE